MQQLVKRTERQADVQLNEQRIAHNNCLQQLKTVSGLTRFMRQQQREHTTLLLQVQKEEEQKQQQQASRLKRKVYALEQKLEETQQQSLEEHLQEFHKHNKGQPLTFTAVNHKAVTYVPRATLTTDTPSPRTQQRVRQQQNRTFGNTEEEQQQHLEIFVGGKNQQKLIDVMPPMPNDWTIDKMLLLHAHGLSLDNIQLMRNLGITTPTVAQVIAASQTHSLPIEEKKVLLWDADTHKMTAQYFAGFKSARQYIESAFLECLQNGDLQDLPSFPISGNVIPIKMTLDDGGGSSKLVFGFLQETKDIARLLQILECKGSWSNLQQYGWIEKYDEELAQMLIFGSDIQGKHYAWDLTFCDDYEQACDNEGHAGASTTKCCLSCHVKTSQIQDNVWEDIAATVLLRTREDYLSSYHKVKQFINQGRKKQVSSCVCGEFGHTQSTHSQSNGSLNKNDAICGCCGGIGHWRNSNKDNSTGNNTNPQNKDCLLWTTALKWQMKDVAEQQAGFAEIKLSTTDGINKPHHLFPKVWETGKAKRGLSSFHATYLGEAAKVLKALDILIKHCDSNKWQGKTNLTEEVTETIYKELHCRKTHHFGGTYNGNHTHKLLQNCDVFLQKLVGLEQHQLLSDWFHIVAELCEVTNRSAVLSEIETEQLQKLIKQYGQFIRQPQLVAFFGNQATIKTHQIEAHFMTCVNSNHMLGRFSEGFIEPAHHQVSKMHVNPVHKLKQQLHIHKLQASAVVNNAQPVTKQRGPYNCHACQTHGIIVLKAGHKCPHKL